jgi:hypothetical protein
MSHSFRSIYEPHICGDALDFTDNGDTLLSGAYDKHKQLSTWSFPAGKRMERIPWSIAEEKSTCMLYSAGYSKNPTRPNRFIVAAGAGEVNEVKIFSDATKRVKTCACSSVSILTFAV